MKLSARLMKINDMVESHYDHIWDCCCDHGFLGSALISREIAQKIHFVDIVPELMDLLENKLKALYLSSAWETHCIDVTTLPLNHYKGKHLIIIAGIGGDLMIKLITTLHEKYANLNIDFLLCPVHHQFSLRSTLMRLNFGMKNEALIEDNKRFYEIILVSNTMKKNNPISLIGEEIWVCETPQKTAVIMRYLHKTLNHYNRIQQGGTDNVQHIINAYNAIENQTIKDID